MQPDALRKTLILLALPIGVIAISAGIGPQFTKAAGDTDGHFGFAKGGPPETAVAPGSVALVGSLTPASKRFGVTLVVGFPSVHEAQESRSVVRGLLVDSARHFANSPEDRARLLDDARSAPVSPAVSTQLADRGVVLNGLGIGYAGTVDGVDATVLVMSHVLVVRNLKADVEGERTNPLAALCAKLGGQVFAEGGPISQSPPWIDLTCLARTPVDSARLLEILQSRYGRSKVRAEGRQLQLGNIRFDGFVQQFPLLILALEQEGCTDIHVELSPLLTR